MDAKQLDRRTDLKSRAGAPAEAGVKTLVLTHFVPSAPTGYIPDEDWIAAAKTHFRGEVIAGRDLMEI